MCVCEAALVVVHDFCAANHVSRARAKLHVSVQLLRTTSPSFPPAMPCKVSLSFPLLVFPRAWWCCTRLPLPSPSPKVDGSVVERVLFVTFSVCASVDYASWFLPRFYLATVEFYAPHRNGKGKTEIYI